MVFCVNGWLINSYEFKYVWVLIIANDKSMKYLYASIKPCQFYASRCCYRGIIQTKHSHGNLYFRDHIIAVGEISKISGKNINNIKTDIYLLESRIDNNLIAVVSLKWSLTLEIGCSTHTIHGNGRKLGYFVNSFSLVHHICVIEWGQHWLRQWHVAYSAPSHSLNQCSVIINWTHRTNFSEILVEKIVFFIQENAIENVVCKMAAICVQRTRHISHTILTICHNKVCHLRNIDRKK